MNIWTPEERAAMKRKIMERWAFIPLDNGEAMHLATYQWIETCIEHLRVTEGFVPREGYLTKAWEMERHLHANRDALVREHEERGFAEMRLDAMIEAVRALPPKQ